MGFLNARRSRLGMIAAGTAMTFASFSPAFADHTLTLPVGTVIPVTLNQGLDSRHNQPGDKFSATVKEGRDDAGLPSGTRVEGVVREALPSADGKPGVLDVDFRRVVMPGGESRAIEGSLYSLKGKDLKRSDGRLVATADKSKDRLKWIGIGAGAGVLLGTLTKGNALFDGLLGAGAGYLYNELQNKKPGDVNLKAGTDFGIRLDRPVTFTLDEKNYYRYRARSNDDVPYDSRVKGNERDSIDRGNDDRYYRNGDRSGDRNGDRSGDDRYYRDNDSRDDRSYRKSIDASGDDIGLVIDNREVKFGAHKPFTRASVVMVPLEPVAKMGDFGYKYNANQRVIRARNGSLRLAVGSRVAFYRGERRTLPAPAELRDGEIYVPMEFVGWLANGSASWDGGSRTVIITTDRD